MPITGKVIFQEAMTNVSILDVVFGGYCTDVNGDVRGRSVQAQEDIDFWAEPDVQTNAGTVVITGTDGAGKVYDTQVNFNSGGTIFFPNPPSTEELIKQFNNFQEFYNAINTR